MINFNRQTANMLNNKYSLIALLLTLFITFSCKKDFTTIGNQLIDKPHFEGKLYDAGYVKIYDQRLDRVFATNSGNENGNNLPMPAVGVYKDAVFGTLKADLATAVSSDNGLFGGDFNNNVQILSARLMIPYFSHTYTDGNEKKYALDSVFGNHAFQIKVYELNYLLQSFDPATNLETHRKYFSDFDFTSHLGQVIGDSVGFVPSAEPVYIYKRNTDGTFELDDNNNPIIKDSLNPHMIIKLDKNFIQQKIFDHWGEDILTNANLFKDYFRGIYIEAVPDNNDGRFMMLQAGDGKIEVEFTYDEVDDNGTPGDTTDDTTETIYKKMTLKLSVPHVNHYENSLTPDAQTALNTSDMTNGDAQIFLKGDAVSEAVIQLFDDQQLRELRLKDWLINQAELYVYVDKNTSEQLLNRAEQLLLYNYDDQMNLVDLSAPENKDNGNVAYDGKLHTDDNGNQYYKFGITRHIRNIISNDSTNVKLGLRITTIIPEYLKAGDVFLDPDAYNPSGIILQGNNSGIKPPVLKIYYSEDR